jgi:hypothetical protein
MRFSISVLALGGLLLCQAEQIECQTEECEASAANTDVAASPPRVPETCTLVYAPVPSDHSEDTGYVEWGVFSLTDRSKGAPVWKSGDVVIQVPDANKELQESALRHFLWDGEETGGQYEGHQTVHSLIPGLGMMTHVEPSGGSNLIPLVPRVDEGGLTRFDSPGAGAITHYHNYTWFIRKPVGVGEELVMTESLRSSNDDNLKELKSEEENRRVPTPEDLVATGYCLDNIRPRKSRIKLAGRGAFATRNMPAGTTIAPVPVLPISSASLEVKSGGRKKQATAEQQLLRNYCLGNTNSTTLLYPYGHMINLINHFTEPNVALQWSEQSQRHLSKPISSFDTEDPPHLLMELVATQDILEGGELYFDYGRAWEDAWFQHTQTWNAFDFHYTPSYVMDDAIKLLRNQQEQKDHEYPKNLFTSCFYRFSDRDESEKALSHSVKADKVNSFQWKMTKGLYDLKHLRPCEVLKRNEDKQGRSAYAVRMLNRPGLPEEEVIPKGTLHIVTHVPRHAIRFSDRAGTTDQHMATAFRHEIGLGNDVFPLAWRTNVEEEEPSTSTMEA